MAERLFVAVPLAPSVRERIAAALPGGLPGRATPPENWHVTLRFLGDTPPALRDALVQALERAELGPAFRVRFGGLGAFPNAGRARVVWMGIEEGAPELVALQARVEAATRAAGFPAEPKPYTPHLTLTRLPRPAPVGGLLARADTRPVDAEVDEVVLYRSRLGGGPARHEALRRFPLDRG